MTQGRPQGTQSHGARNIPRVPHLLFAGERRLTGQTRGQAGRALVVDGLIGAGDPDAPSSRVFGPLTHEFHAGGFHVLAGADGPARACLLGLLRLVQSPLHGQIRWGEQILTALPQQEQTAWRRSELARVSRVNRLISVMTVRDHVRLAATIRGRPGGEEDGLHLLDALGMAARLDSLPDQLSSSEKQRLALVQALCVRPAVLLADEPTAALDRASAALAAHVLRRYARESGAVVICASYDAMMADAADTLVDVDAFDQPAGDIA